MLEYSYENNAANNGFTLICGIDEAGRGPLAGPVYAAAVILPQGLIIPGLNDSKKLSEKKRELLFDIIADEAADYGIGIATEKEVDEINILQATLLAMKRAYENLKGTCDYALVDGNKMPSLSCKGETLIKGDAISPSIAAASILAKVSRDRFMYEMDIKYPEYHFAKHKGYGTRVHTDVIRDIGPCPIHRITFLKKILEG